MTTSTEGVVQFHVSVKVDMAEFAHWQADRIAAFFNGIAAVLAAKGALDRYATFQEEQVEETPEENDIDGTWQDKVIEFVQQEREEAPKGTRGICSTCNSGFASARHLNECPVGAPKNRGKHHVHCWDADPIGSKGKDLCPCGMTRTEWEALKATNSRSGAVECERCGGQVYLDGEGDIVCLQCGARKVLAAP